MLLVEGIREGSVKRDRVIAMLMMFAFNVLFWMFFEQAGSSFNFLAQNIVDRNLDRLGIPDRLVPVRQSVWRSCCWRRWSRWPGAG